MMLISMWCVNDNALPSVLYFVDVFVDGLEWPNNDLSVQQVVLKGTVLRIKRLFIHYEGRFLLHVSCTCHQPNSVELN